MQYRTITLPRPIFAKRNRSIGPNRRLCLRSAKRTKANQSYPSITGYLSSHFVTCIQWKPETTLNSENVPVTHFLSQQITLYMVNDNTTYANIVTANWPAFTTLTDLLCTRTELPTNDYIAVFRFRRKMKKKTIVMIFFTKCVV